MSEAVARLAEQARQLRNDFDAGFAEAARGDDAVLADLLTLRAEGEPYALRLAEIAGLFADRKITPLPGGRAGLLGCAVFRGSIAPVYDLHALLGHAAAAPPHWLALAAQAPVAFAFEAFEGHRSVRQGAILPREAGDFSRPFIRDFVSEGQEGWPLVHLPSVLAALGERRARRNLGSQED
ncbi:MAG: chemotaxis protein CheW [Caulobacteraceae bacterium]|nr:chemotaxis protein CheW [Caulobacteraceae bacterium]